MRQVGCNLLSRLLKSPELFVVMWADTRLVGSFRLSRGWSDGINLKSSELFVAMWANIWLDRSFQLSKGGSDVHLIAPAACLQVSPRRTSLGILYKSDPDADTEESLSLAVLSISFEGYN
ncbi:hypothetical protein CY34DRAFT_367188 [Suillus luteus UH-Slu-Lm8-n1]|uniref:Unplaced genomic scaffold CY34scaffold_24, whole genome shotgun sequence n=1 Tax=Suillus luteus UH-Slu-Lm8-n1 TaxID=930992 RepID=A0A0D0BAF6_9AGAM|nr:hypothetical protein CY34DRAFT_367188 [Suillus luteus UH-Slu-Lm8-n1]